MGPTPERSERWHELFDELCSRAGFTDSNSLAARYCSETNGKGQNQFETAVRNINNWRSGRHLPRPRSLRILEQMLEVDANPNLLERWNALYRQARLDEPEETERAADAPTAPARRFPMGMPAAVAAGTALFALGITIGAAVGSGWRPWGGPADDAPFIVYHPHVRLVVGQSMVVHGERGDCGELPREWRDVVGHLPTSTLGEFSDGGLVRRHSMFCKGITPARGIRFTATNPGMEEMYITGDYMKISVVARDDEAAAVPADGIDGPP